MENLKKSVQNLIGDVVNPKEQRFLNELTNHDAANVMIQKDKIISDFYIAKKSELIMRDLIDSNEKLSESSTRQAKALAFFTAGIFFLGIVQIVLAILGII